jgi:CheY-like chemotaxis protein
MPSILIVDDEVSFRLMVSDFLGDYYDVAAAECGAEALKLLSLRSFDLVISDICMPGMDGVELLRAIRKLYPTIKTVLMTANDIDQFLQLAMRDGIANIIAKTVPFNFSEVGAVVKGLVTGEIFGLSRYLLSDGAVIADYRITSSEEGCRVRDEIATLMQERFNSAGDLKLVVDEMITNAIYHAPSGGDGKDKYSAYNNITLSPEEYVWVECGFDHEKCGVSITDMKGRLTKEIALSKIHRQLSGDGLLDTSGRGIHISRLIADRMIINIDRGKKTEIIVMNYRNHAYHGYKPFYINEL